MNICKALLIVIVGLVGTSFCQESKLEAEWRVEREHLQDSCSKFKFKALGGCAISLFTEHPFHVAIGSLAPQNGFSAGLAFVEHANTKNWRTSWNADGVVSQNASWRTGVYVKLVHTPALNVRVTSSTPPLNKNKIAPRTLVTAYVQATSLKKLLYFGLGPKSSRDNQTSFGMEETIVGAEVVKPLWKTLNMSLLGEINGRLVNISETSTKVPSIESKFSEIDAPGLTSQPAFLQFGEGIRIQPRLFNDHLQLNYFAKLQQFVAPDSSYSFRRFTIDLAHSVPIRNHTENVAPLSNGPDECSVSSSNYSCPPVNKPNYSRDLTGSVRFALLVTQSIASGGNKVPFYFQPTLGGSDINGAATLGSFDDYRFRAPNVFLIRETFEHSIYGPVGLTISAEQGTATFGRTITLDEIKHSFSAGLTLRAGGLPEVFLVFSWGGERSHFLGALNTSLFGGSSRPSLF